jgi:hypothetical protein
MLLAPSLEAAGTELRFSTHVDASLGKLQRSVRAPYLEIQIWRPLALEDVERFEFKNAPPGGAFLQALRKHDVKIFKRGGTDEWKDDGPRQSAT